MGRQEMVGHWRRLPHPIRWVGVAALGSALIVVGIILLVLPGPGLLLIALGVAVLASEFAWAETVMGRMTAAGTAAVTTAKRAWTRRRG